MYVQICIGIFFDLVWSHFILPIVRHGWSREVADNLNDDPALWLSISCSCLADVCRLNEHNLRLVDVLDIQEIQTSLITLICSWFVFLRPHRTSTLRSLVTWLQEDRRQVEGHFDIAKHGNTWLQHFAAFCSCIVSRTTNRAVLVCSDLKNLLFFSSSRWDELQ